MGWLETEWLEGQTHEAVRSVGNQPVFMCRIRVREPTGTKSRPTEVRASIVVRKRGNSRGAKGRRKMDARSA